MARKKKAPKAAVVTTTTMINVTVEMVPASGSSATRIAQLPSGASVADALKAVKAAGTKRNVFLNDLPLDEAALATTQVFDGNTLRVMERPAGS